MTGRWGVLVAIAAAVVATGAACTTQGGGTGAEPVQDAAPVADLAQEPEVVLPEAAPVTLQVTEVVEGEGDPVVTGDAVTVHLVVYALSTRTKVDSTWTLDAPRRMQLVEGAAIPGFIQGVAGMLVGGRRTLVIPPDLAYGQAGAPPAVGSEETLVMVVDLLEIERAG